MKKAFLKIVMDLSDWLRDVFDRLHGWALNQRTELNLRQLKLDYRTKNGWWK